MKIFLIVLLTSFGMKCYSQQSIDFSYDAAGNQILKKLTVEVVVIVNARKGKEIDSTTNKGDYTVMLYPNPTSYLLNIETSGLPLDTTWQLTMYDLSGKQLFIEKVSNDKFVKDLSAFPAGLYFLQTFIRNEIKKFKIIKE